MNSNTSPPKEDAKEGDGSIFIILLVLVVIVGIIVFFASGKKNQPKPMPKQAAQELPHSDLENVIEAHGAEEEPMPILESTPNVAPVNA